jgi:hypothetical protein
MSAVHMASFQQSKPYGRLVKLPCTRQRQTLRASGTTNQRQIGITEL